MQLREHKPLTLSAPKAKSGGGVNMAPEDERAYFGYAEALADLALKFAPLNPTRISHILDIVKERLLAASQLSEAEKNARELQKNTTVLSSLEAQGIAAREAEFRRGSLLSAADFQQKLGISRQAINKAIHENRMFYLDGASGENRYPAFFADGRHDRRNLEKVCKVLGNLPGASKWQFFTTAKVSLGNRTPLTSLASGDLDAVLQAAAGFAER